MFNMFEKITQLLKSVTQTNDSKPSETDIFNTTILILDTAEQLNHDQRWEYMLGLGRESKQSSVLADAIYQLAQSDVHYERMLAMMSTQGSADSRVILHLLNDASSIGIRTVISQAAKHLNESDLLTIMPSLPIKRRSKLIQKLADIGRTDINEKLFFTLNKKEQAYTVGMVSFNFIQEHKNTIDWDLLSSPDWRRLTKRFPEFTAELVLARISGKTTLSWGLQEMVWAFLIQSYHGHAQLGVNILEKVIDILPFYYIKIELSRFALQFPQKIAELILQHHFSDAISLPASVLKRLDNKTLAALIEKNHLPNLLSLFTHLHYLQRNALYELFANQWRDNNGLLSPDMVEALNAEARKIEAQRGLSHPLLQARPLSRTGYLAALNSEDAISFAQEFLNQPDGDIRAAAVSSIVKSARFNATSLVPILDFCVYRQNEQDPVRLAMVSALETLPPTRWQTEHLPQIKKIIKAGLDARDISAATLSCLSRWLVKLIINHPEFASEELPLVIERSGRIGGCPRAFESRLNNTQMEQLAPKLLPLMNVWNKRGDHALNSIALIWAFGRRAWVIPEFIIMLKRLLSDNSATIAHNALNALAEFRIPKSIKHDLLERNIQVDLKHIIPELIKKDESWICISLVSWHLLRHHSSLLTPFLQAKIYSGKFNSGRKSELIAFNSELFHYFSSQQQNIYAKALKDILKSSSRTIWERRSALNSLVLLPSININSIASFASIEMKDINLRDLTISALGWADAGRAVPLLLECLEDNRARVAIYALRRALLKMPANTMFNYLNRVSSSKVTVVKELIRLVGEIDSPESLAFLQNYMANDDELHRDVKIALMRALWMYLDRDDVWEYFHSAAKSERAALARATIYIPHTGLNTHSQQHLSVHIGLLLQHPNAQVKQETLQRLISMPLEYMSTDLFGYLIRLLNDNDAEIIQLATQIILPFYSEKADYSLISEFISVDYDYSLEAIVQAFIRQKKYKHSDKLVGYSKEFARQLIEKPRQIGLALYLAFRLFNASDILKFIQTVEQKNLLHPGIVELVLLAEKEAIQQWDMNEFNQLEAELRVSPSVFLRRMGLGLLLVSAEKYGWEEHYQTALTVYQNDKEYWISEAAKLVRVWLKAV